MNLYFGSASLVRVSLFFLATAGALDCLALDWSGYRGARGDGVSAEKIQPWPAAGLKQLWTAPAQTGFSSIALGDGKAFTVVRRKFEGNDHEACVALDAATGKELWAVKLSLAKYDGGGDSGGGGDGPRTTPAFGAGIICVYDAQFVLTGLNAKTGAPLWRHEILKEYGGKMFTWQNASSARIEGDLVLVAGGGPGQALLAFNLADGKLAWKSQDDGATHSSPVIAEIGGVRQVIFYTQQGLVALAPKTGDVLWRYKFPFKTSAGASPVVAGDLVYCSAGYNVGAGVVRVTKQGTGFQATELWRKPNELLNHWSTPVVKDGYLYGLFGHGQFNKAPLKCVELSTGKEMWSQPDFGMGGLILAGDNLLVLSDKGQLVLAEAKPAAYKELSRMAAVGGKCWSVPALSDGKIYLRSTTAAVCLDAAAR